MRGRRERPCGNRTGEKRTLAVSLSLPKPEEEDAVSNGDNNVRFGSKADIRTAKKRCPLYSQKRTSAAHKQMSAEGQKQTIVSSAEAALAPNTTDQRAEISFKLIRLRQRRYGPDRLRSCRRRET